MLLAKYNPYDYKTLVAQWQDSIGDLNCLAGDIQHALDNFDDMNKSERKILMNILDAIDEMGICECDPDKALEVFDDDEEDEEEEF